MCAKRGVLRGECAQNRGESVVESTIEIGREKHATFSKFIFGRTCKGSEVQGFRLATSETDEVMKKSPAFFRGCYKTQRDPFSTFRIEVRCRDARTSASSQVHELVIGPVTLLVESG